MMKLISTVELDGQTERELANLFTEISRNLTRTEWDSAERRNSLASLENISAARCNLVMAGL